MYAMDKLQELTRKLYEEGLAKGKEEGEAVLAQARAEAEAIIRQAREEAGAIVAGARKEAEDYRTKVEGDVKMAAVQALQATRARIGDLIVADAVDAPVKAALQESGYLKEIILAVAKGFSAQESSDLSLVLPEKLRAELEPFVKNEVSRIIGKGIETGFSKKFDGGLKIGPKDGSYFISLTDEAFAALIGEYLRPASKKILFGA